MKKLTDEELEELVCNYKGSKYEAAVLAMQWARYLRKLEENQNLTASDIIDKAIKEIVGGKIKPEEVLNTLRREVYPQEAVAAESGKKAKKEK